MHGLFMQKTYQEACYSGMHAAVLLSKQLLQQTL